MAVKASPLPSPLVCPPAGTFRSNMSVVLAWPINEHLRWFQSPAGRRARLVGYSFLVAVSLSDGMVASRSARAALAIPLDQTCDDRRLFCRSGHEIRIGAGVVVGAVRTNDARFFCGQRAMRLPRISRSRESLTPCSRADAHRATIVAAKKLLGGVLPRFPAPSHAIGAACLHTLSVTA
jgi:hypothetical protein